MYLSFSYLVPNKQSCGVIYNEGIAVLSALAKSRSARVSLQFIDLGDFRAGNYFVPADADMHAVTYASGQHSLARQYLRALRGQAPQALIAVGGIHATVDRASVVAMPEADIVCSGEGEHALFALMDYAVDRTRVPNLPNVHLRGMPLRPLEKVPYADVNALPFPDRSIFDRALLARSPEFIFSRGCPHSCAYCANSFLNKNFGCIIRRKSPEYCIAEIDNAKAVLGFGDDTMLTFHDDIFLTDMEWLREFARLYTARHGNPFRCNTSAKAVNRENIALLKEMHCAELWIGIETGNEELRRKVLHKHVSNQRIIEAFDLANGAGLNTVSFMMVGIPGESRQSILDSMRLNRRCRVFSTSVARFQPFPGTPLYDKAREENAIRPLTEEQLDLGVGIFGLAEGNLTFHELNYYTLLLYHYSKRDTAPYLYLKLFRWFLNKRSIWKPFWAAYGRVCAAFPERRKVLFERGKT